MEGVNLLYEFKAENQWLLAMWFALSILFSCAFINNCMMTCFKGWKNIIKRIVLFVCAGFCMYAYIAYTPLTGTHVEYEAILSENVDMNAFNNQYEIVKQKGQIYVIKER